MVRVFVLMAMLLLTAPAFAADPAAAGEKAGFSDAPPPPPPPPATKETPRTDKPMEDYTKYYSQKEFTVSAPTRHTLTYYLRQPKPESGKTYPLVVVLHDEKGMAAAGEYLLTKDLLDAYPSYIIVPVLPVKKIWAFPEKFPDNPPMEQTLGKMPQALPDVMELIDDIHQNFHVDDKRIYVVGCGDGGFGAFGAAAKHPSIFAAAIPIDGGWTQKEAPKLKKVPLFVVHGMDDKVYEPGLSQNVAFWVQKFKGPVNFLPIAGLGHDCADPRLYQKALWKWMYGQHKS